LQEVTQSEYAPVQWFWQDSVASHTRLQSPPQQSPVQVVEAVQSRLQLDSNESQLVPQVAEFLQSVLQVCAAVQLTSQLVAS
jgi:hypothetical protein